MASDLQKQRHFKKLLILLYIAHLLPLACKSDAIMGNIFRKEDPSSPWYGPRNFHANFTLDRWNDYIIQPARDAVLDYYKVRTPYPTYTVLALIPIQYQPLFIL